MPHKAALKKFRRIPVILDLLHDLWMACPNESFFKLTLDAIGSRGDPYDIDDNVLREKLEHAVELHERKTFPEISHSQS